MGAALFLGEEVARHRLLPGNRPWSDRVGDDLDRLMLDVRKGRPLKVADLVRRDTEDRGDLVALELPGLEELRLLGRHPDRDDLHRLFQHGRPMRIEAPGICLVP